MVCPPIGRKFGLEEMSVCEQTYPEHTRDTTHQRKYFGRTCPTSVAAVVITPLHPIFAAELEGADLRAEPTDELVRTVEDAMDRYAVLVVRGQQIDDEQHLRF